MHVFVTLHTPLEKAIQKIIILSLYILTNIAFSYSSENGKQKFQ